MDDFCTGLNRRGKNIKNNREIGQTSWRCIGPRRCPRSKRGPHAVTVGAYCMASLSNSFS